MIMNKNKHITDVNKSEKLLTIGEISKSVVTEQVWRENEQIVFLGLDTATKIR